MTLSIALRAEEKATPFSLARVEYLFGFTYLPFLAYQDWRVERALSRRSARAERRRRIGALALWLGSLHDKELSEAAIPPVAIRWIEGCIGYGLFALAPFPAWHFLGEYTGILRPRRLLKPETNDYCFMYPRAWWPGGNYLIDSALHGNYTRFINHSDTPNCESVAVYQNQRFHILFRTLRPIAAGEELTYDYGDRYWDRRKKSLLPTPPASP